MSSFMANATFPGSVHGVVVHAKMYVLGSLAPLEVGSLEPSVLMGSTSSNFTVIEMSVISLYPSATSLFESVVSHRGHICIDLNPL